MGRRCVAPEYDPLKISNKVIGMKKNLAAYGIGLALAAVSGSALALDEIRINGFLTAAATQTDADSAYNADLATPDLQFNGRDNRLGIQLSADVNERVEVTAQLLARAVPDNYNVEADWAYASYAVHDQLKIRAGKVKLPTFLTSDYIEVGYAYPWVRPPQEVYSLNPITSMSGIDLLYTPVFGDITLLIQPYYGNSTGSGFVTGMQAYAFGAPDLAGDPVDFDAKDLAGINLAVQTDVYTVRAGYLTTKVSSDFATPSGPIDEDKAQFMSVGFTMDWNDVVAYAEWASRDEDGNAEIGFPDQEAWYATIGYRMGPWLPTLTYAQLKAGDPDNASVDAYALEQTSTSFGLRYELGLGADIKFEALYVNPEKGNFGLYDGPLHGSDPFSTDASSDAMVYTLTLDVIF